MRIKHIPSGLFPHFDCGYERRPFRPLAGETVSLSCMLDDFEDGSAVSLHLSVNGAAPVATLSDKPGKTDGSRAYFTFIFVLPPSLSNIEYWFTARSAGSDELKSSRYSFETLKTVKLKDPDRIGFSGNSVHAVYQLGQNRYILSVSLSERVEFFLARYLTDKIKTESMHSGDSFRINDDFTMKIILNPFKLEFYRKSLLIACIIPVFELFRDQHEKVVGVSFESILEAEAVYGFGEKFDSVNQIGRQPYSYVVEQYSNQLDKTYLPVPFYFSEGGIGFANKGTMPVRHSVKRVNVQAVIRTDAECDSGDILFSENLLFGKPSEIIGQFTEQAGKPKLPEKWVFGPWMSSNGWNTQKEALYQVERMNELAVPATVMVLEAWSDEETFYIWNDAKYKPREDGSPFSYDDFTFAENGKWPDPMQFARALGDNGLKLVLWQIPVIKYERSKHGRQLDLDTEYAVKNSLCIRNKDGEPYRITDLWFANSLMPDFSNPDALKWWFDKRKYLVEEMGVAGFKTDGGEFLFDKDAILADGRSGLEAHNGYPNMYIGAYHHFMEESLGKNRGITFSRAGFTGAQRYPVHWAGDQISNWNELRGQLTAGLSAGLSGIPFWGFDIGGFAGEFPTTELYLRSAGLALFSPIMQFHSEPRYGQYYMTERDRWNNDRSPWNMALANGDDRIVPVYRLFANLRMNLLPYIFSEAAFTSKTSRPLMAHLIIDYPEDRNVLNIEDEFMFGRNILVAPIIRENARAREVYLPAGRWTNLFTGGIYEGSSRIAVECGLETVPAFIKDKSVIPLNINKAYKMGSTGIGSSISNKYDTYDNLVFLAFGSAAGSFSDENGNHVEITIENNVCHIRGTLKQAVSILRFDEYGLENIVLNGNMRKIFSDRAELFGRSYIAYGFTID